MEQEAASFLLQLRFAQMDNNAAEDRPSVRKRPRRSKKFSSETSSNNASPPAKKKRKITTKKITKNKKKTKKNKTTQRQEQQPVTAGSPKHDAPTVAAAASLFSQGTMCLAMPDDHQQLNSLHCLVRSELLEVFPLLDETTRGDKKNQSSRSSSMLPPRGRPRRVGIRCVHCGHLPRKEKMGASMSTFFPKSLEDIYRLVCTWQRVHFKHCQHIPEEVSNTYWRLKENDRTRGKKSHWVTSAYRLGLRDADGHRGGIVWNPEDQNEEQVEI
jgi:hypothetical protein